MRRRIELGMEAQDILEALEDLGYFKAIKEVFKKLEIKE